LYSEKSLREVHDLTKRRLILAIVTEAVRGRSTDQTVEGYVMDIESMSREELIAQIREMNAYMDNVVVFWGGKRELRETLVQVAANREEEYSEQEAKNAAVVLSVQGAFDEFVQLLRDSFERGGINYMLSEKISALMEEVASRQGKN